MAPNMSHPQTGQNGTAQRCALADEVKPATSQQQTRGGASGAVMAGAPKAAGVAKGGAANGGVAADTDAASAASEVGLPFRPCTGCHRGCYTRVVVLTMEVGMEQG